MCYNSIVCHIIFHDIFVLHFPFVPHFLPLFLCHNLHLCYKNIFYFVICGYNELKNQSSSLMIIEKCNFKNRNKK
ncbi:hypothetical protein Msp_0476 [Methanosphaera stadtmanae DSM 3091]|uniref:Uncharacterized protein n=1 Tax=Methanosphaera stadtmanae (strain ATCC 43021 / DSM 3091 / JCM 11832 / MCB-3) TaxID=339860 RepID=Q2NH27_METST|nr:hypothetical protein Msp_0476 [Methanosphaera stadtmanae DSM 3091]